MREGAGAERGAGVHQHERQEVLRHEEELHQVPQQPAQLHGENATEYTGLERK